jgi:hypothetical protein
MKSLKSDPLSIEKELIYNIQEEKSSKEAESSEAAVRLPSSEPEPKSSKQKDVWAIQEEEENPNYSIKKLLTNIKNHEPQKQTRIVLP